MNEIEKKYLVQALPDISIYESTNISQGYLSIEPNEIRIRMMGDKCFLTEKGDGTLVRPEKETPISIDAFGILYGMVKGAMIEKTRVFVPIEQGYTAELDIYHGFLEGLLTVEVEFPSEEAALEFIPPIWFGEDITSDKRFKNKSLATSQVNLDELMHKKEKMRTLENNGKD